MSVLEPGSFDPLVHAMCEKYRYEEPHCQRVAGLAQSLFDLLRDLHGLGEEEARLLRHGALLHDIGHFVAYRAHHKHGAFLIAWDAALSGYPKAGRHMLAYLTRCHRKRAVPPPSKEALQLAALLRLADGLDHDRAGSAAVTGAKVTDRKIRLTVTGVDLEKLASVLKRKASLMPRAFGRRVVWEP